LPLYFITTSAIFLPIFSGLVKLRDRFVSAVPAKSMSSGVKFLGLIFNDLNNFLTFSF
jgi:hypothetical protein